MRIIRPQVRISQTDLSRQKVKLLDRYARTCYKSEDKQGDTFQVLQRCIASGHTSVLEHEKITVLFVCDRGISHELVRHRTGTAFSQESTRYTNYSKDCFDNQITVIAPYYLLGTGTLYDAWEHSCLQAEQSYMFMLQNGCTPQEARAVLPTCLKTEIVTTCNIREWRHMLYLRCARDAHPQMRQIMIPLLAQFKTRLPELFGDITYDMDFPVGDYAEILLTNAMLMEEE